MTTISCIVIDDEPLAVQLMESYVRKTPFLDLKGSFTNGKEAFVFIQENPVDLMFCDIQMPDLSGIDLSKMIPEETKVIFTTAFSQYAIEGFKVHALDYLLKPISYDDFLASAKHALKTLTTDISGQPSGPGRVHSRFAAAEYGLSPAAESASDNPEDMRSSRMRWRWFSYGSIFPIACCALRSFAEATSFIAEVIFSVLPTEAILPFISLREAIRHVIWPQQRPCPH